MTNEEKQLLLKDLSARLPYGVKVNYKGLIRPLFSVSPTQHYQITLDNAIDGEHNGLEFVSLDVDSAGLKPYLRPLSSMTEEEKRELKATTCPNGTGYFDEKYLLCPMNHYGEQISYEFMQSIIDWLNARHFDYRGLIEKGLAIAVTEENNPYKE